MRHVSITGYTDRYQLRSHEMSASLATLTGINWEVSTGQSWDAIVEAEGWSSQRYPQVTCNHHCHHGISSAPITMTIGA